MKKRQKENIAMVIAISMMIVLFISSSQPYHQQTAIPFLRELLHYQPFESDWRGIAFLYANKTISIQELGYFEFVEFFIRKFAHFFSYFMLGYTWLYALFGKMRDKKSALFITFILCVSYAALDEFHQSLTPNRTALLEDVILDSFGAAFGMLFLQIKQLFNRKRR